MSSVSVFDLMVASSETVLKEMMENWVVFCRDAKVGDGVEEETAEYAGRVCHDTLQGIADDLDLVIQNEDWDWLSGEEPKQMYEFNNLPLRTPALKNRFLEVLNMEKEGGEYNCEKAWGVLPREPFRMGERDRAEQLAIALMQPFEQMQRESLNALGTEDVRQSEAVKCKNAVSLFVQRYYAEMRKRVPELRR